MISIDFLNTKIEISLSNDSKDLDFDSWEKYVNDYRQVSILNDLVANGVASKSSDNKRIIVSNELLDKIDDEDKDILLLPPQYPYDIYVEFLGTGLKDTNSTITYSFQDNALGGGAGDIFDFKVKGVSLGNDEVTYILSSKQYELIRDIEKFKNNTSRTSQQSLFDCMQIKKKAKEAEAFMSRIFLETELTKVDKVRLDIGTSNDVIKLSPHIEELEDSVNNRFKTKFIESAVVRNEYNVRDSNNIKNRIVLNSDNKGEPNALQKQLNKIKIKDTYTRSEISEQYENPNEYWDADIIDIDDFSRRVIELGLYKPKFYPFISPYKSEWIPGFVKKDKVGGDVYIKIENDKDLIDIKTAYKESLCRGNKNVEYRGENIPIEDVPDIIANAESQLNDKSKPSKQKISVDENNHSEKKVLIIKENTLELEYKERLNDVKVINTYNFVPVSTLSEDIEYKSHQEEGIAWMQTLYRQPVNSPGCLLADDMGLGKTIQVLSFIEWYSSIKKGMPILIVAPVALLENWEIEHNKFFNKSKLGILKLCGKSISKLFVKNNKNETLKNFSSSNIYMTTYETLRRYQIGFGLIDWGVVVLDEAQKIKTPGTLVTNSVKALKADFKIAMTGTPVENSLMDLWCIMDFCCPGMLGNAKDFSKKYQTPLQKEDIDFKGLSDSLREDIGMFLMRRLKKDVAKDLPAIKYYKIQEPMPGRQMREYNSELNKVKESLDSKDSSNSILSCLINLRNISDHPFINNFRIESFSTDELIGSSAKLKVSVKILDQIKDKDEKVIVFSHSKKMQKIFQRIIKERYFINSY